MFDVTFLIDDVLPALNRGLLISIALIVPSAILGFIGGILVGVQRVYGSPLLRKLGDWFVAIFRGVPLAVQLMLIYFALPKLGLVFEPYVAALISFTLCSTAYHSEYIRGALFSIGQGQIKAAHALGMTTTQTILFIIIPQAARRALPGCGNEFIYLIKYSSLAYLVTCMELMGEGKVVASNTFRFTEVFIVVGIYYLAMVTMATFTLHKLEKKFKIPGFGAK